MAAIDDMGREVLDAGCGQPQLGALDRKQPGFLSASAKIDVRIVERHGVKHGVGFRGGGRHTTAEQPIVVNFSKFTYSKP